MAVSFAAEDGIGVITLDKPPANSYDLARSSRSSPRRCRPRRTTTR